VLNSAPDLVRVSGVLPIRFSVNCQAKRSVLEDRLEDLRSDMKDCKRDADPLLPYLA